MSAPEGTEWSAEQEALLRELWAEGATARRIGAIIGKTRNAVVGKVRRLDLPRRRYRHKVTRPMRIARPSRKPTAPVFVRHVKPPVIEDTRSPWARLVGDPLPGRSALDQRVAASSQAGRTTSWKSGRKLASGVEPAESMYSMEDRHSNSEAVA